VDKSYFNFQESLNIETDAVHLSDEIHENRKNEVDSSKDNSWAARKHGFQINDSDSSEESDEGDESDDFDIEMVDSDMKKLVVPRLESAMVAADHAEPSSQLRSILLEMDEEKGSVRRVEDRMRPILKKAAGLVTGDAHLEHCSEISAVRKTMRDYIGHHENMHEQASKSLKAVISIGKDIEETIFLSKANDVNRKFGFSGQMNVFPLLQGSSVLPAPESQLSPDIVQIDRDVDTKEVEIVRALNAIEEKTDLPKRRPASLARASAKSSISPGSSSYMMGDNTSGRVKMVKQLHSSLGLHESRIKRVLVMLKAMEAELREHRRLLGGHKGADIGLSQARLEKLSLSGPDAEGNLLRLKE
jgi:hypothetical protein